MLSSLTDAKINGDYEVIDSTAPAGTDNQAAGFDIGDRWLDTSTGYSYIFDSEALSVATWIRTNKALDNKLTYRLGKIEVEVLDYLNNRFYTRRLMPYTGDVDTDWLRGQEFTFLQYECAWSTWVFDSATKEISYTGDIYHSGLLTELEPGDKLFAPSLRNAEYLTVVSVVAEVITVSETITDETYTGFIHLCRVPTNFTSAVGALAWYEVTQRGTPGLSSEKIGTYSYSRDTSNIGGLAYPAELVSRLDAFRLVAMGGTPFIEGNQP